MSDYINHAARAMDPDAFADRNPQRPSAELQWAVRRKIATDHAEALDAAGLLRRPEDPEVDIEITATGRTCVVKSSGQIIFNGVGREALTRTQSAVQHDAAVAARALRDASDDFYVASSGTSHRAHRWLHDRADRIEREGGAS